MEYQKLILKMTALAAGQTSMWLLTESYLRITRDGAVINDILSSYRSLTQTDLLAIKKVTETPEIVEPFESFFEALNWYLQTKIGSSVTRKLSSWAGVADFWEECGRFEAYIKVKQIFVKLGLAYEDDVCGRGLLVGRVSLAAEFYNLTYKDSVDASDLVARVSTWLEQLQSKFDQQFESTEAFSIYLRAIPHLLKSPAEVINFATLGILAELDENVHRSMLIPMKEQISSLSIMRKACWHALGSEDGTVIDGEAEKAIEFTLIELSNKLLRAVAENK